MSPGEGAGARAETAGDVWRLSAGEQAAAIRRGDVSSEEVTASVLARIAQTDAAIGAFCTIDDRALEAARAADEALRRGIAPGPLQGVPFSVKDLIPTAGLRTTLGSTAHRDWVPDLDEIAVERMRAAGGILIGKTNTRELGYGVVTDNALFGPTRNPWDPRMTATGSSGGAAAAVAAGMGSIALGSDGGGSIRVPAAACGVIGLKPSYGVVPLYPSCREPLRVGLDSWGTLECIGPLTRTVADAALVLSVIAGFDSRDRWAVPADRPMGAPDAHRARGLRIAYSADLGIAEVDPEVAAVVRDAVARVADAQGWVMLERQPALSPLAELRAAFAATVAEDSDLEALARLADAEEVSPDIRELVDRHWSASEFFRARLVRQRLHEAFRRFFTEVDVLITPATATTAFPLGLRHPDDGAGGIADGRQWSPFAFLANLTGQPAVAIPAGLTAVGLPVGLQAMTRRFEDASLLHLARAFEESNPWGRP